MSENKQTLFRFKTMRAPKKKEAGSTALVQIGSAYKGDCVFFEAVAGKDPGQSKIDALKEAAETFTPYASEQAAIAEQSELYEFGAYLLKNRKTLTYADVVSNHGALSTPNTLTDTQATHVWDNLIYQSVTMESVLIREALLAMLLGNQMSAIIGSLSTDADVRKWANAKIVLPNELFSAEENVYVNATTPGVTLPNETLLAKHIGAAESHMKAEIGIAALADLGKYKKAFYRENLPKETAAVREYYSGIGKNIMTASSEVTRDPISGDLIKKATPVIPGFTYIRPQEVDSDEYEGVLDPATVYLMDELGVTDVKTFDEVEKELKDYIQKHQDDAFRGTSFKVEKLSVNGTLLPKCSLESRYNQAYSYMLKPVLVGEDKYNFLLSVDTGSTCAKLLAVEFGTDEGTGLFEDFTWSNKDGVVTVNLTPKGPSSYPEISTVTAAGNLTFDNGMKLTFGSVAVGLGKSFSGIMAPFHLDTTLHGPFVPSGFGLTRIGIADYRKVVQTLCCYVPGEVSHIENVMAREYKERSTRRLRRSEDTTTLSSSSEREQQTDTTSTSRFDMQKEISSVLQETREQTRDISAHASLSGDIPTVGSFEVGGDFASSFGSSTSQEQSEKQTVTEAKEIVEKALNRVVTKVSEERVTKIIEEFEEQNRHGFDNRQGAEHISGVYRWVDKIYKNEVHNYGKRLQYEFMIPEPASFHIATKTALSEAGSETPVVKPLDPRTGSFGSVPALSHAGLVTADNYLQWAAVYGATVAPPPDEVKMVSASLIRPDGDWDGPSKTVTDQIGIPEGYGIRRIFVAALGNGDGSIYRRFYVSVGCATTVLWTNERTRILVADIYSIPELDKYTDTIPFSVEYTCFDGGIVTTELELVRKPAAYANWQMDTFNAIVQAYEDRLAEYKDSLAQVEAQKGVLMGDNPAYLRRTEKTVLKKNCMAYLIGHLNMGKNFITGQTTASIHVQQNMSMDKYAATVKFFEQAFEWEIMDYLFYPFYWGDRAKWGQLYGRDNDDALFRSFLQAGMARTVVTVRPGFEQAVMYYMTTGLIWNGGTPPVIGDDLYTTIMEEIADPEYTLEETWESRVPSSLTVIQAKTIALNAEGLPCYCDDEEVPVETIEQPEVDPLAGLDIFIPGSTTTEEPTP